MAITGQEHKAFKSPKTRWWLLALVLGALVTSGSLVSGNTGSNTHSTNLKQNNTPRANTGFGGQNTTTNQVVAGTRSGNYSNTNVQINGKQIPVPPNGIISKTYNYQGGQAKVNVQVNNSSSGGLNETSSSSVNVDFNSSESN